MRPLLCSQSGRYGPRRREDAASERGRQRAARCGDLRASPKIATTGWAMSDFLTHRHVAYSVDEMFRLVAEVERYPEFLPFCEAHAVRARTVCDGVEPLTTDMTVAYPLVPRDVSQLRHLGQGRYAHPDRGGRRAAATAGRTLDFSCRQFRWLRGRIFRFL